MVVSPTKSIVVLASGEGSNFEAIARAVQSGQIPKARLTALVTNNAKAPVLERARRLSIPTEVVESARYRREGRLDRTAYESELGRHLQQLTPDLICLAGYMLILGDSLIEQFSGRILNIHPSLLPKYRGLNALGQVLAAGEKETGCTVHWVVPEVDAGPIVIQKRLAILENDTETSLRERLRPLEHAAYVEALCKLC